VQNASDGRSGIVGKSDFTEDDFLAQIKLTARFEVLSSLTYPVGSLFLASHHGQPCTLMLVVVASRLFGDMNAD
jgi:hypothetical protein